MENLSDIELIWRGGSPHQLPNAKELLQSIKQYRLRELLKTMALIGFALTLAAVMVWVVVFYESTMIVTRIGEAGIFLGIIILLSSGGKSLIRISSSKNLSNMEFLEQLKLDQARLIRFYNHTQKIGFIISAMGLLLYLYEFVHKEPGPLYWAYSFTVGWILFCWFVIRPRAFKRKINRLTETIEKIQSIADQLIISE